MEPTGSNWNRQRLTIRAGRQSLAFAATENDIERTVTFEPFTVKSGVSIAANMRDALSQAALLDRGIERADVLVDGPTMLVPLDLFEEEQMGELYDLMFTDDARQSVKMFNVMAELSAVAVFAVSRDFKGVIDDHFRDTRFFSTMTPVWKHLYRRSFTGLRRKLYAYFHEQRIDLFSFTRNRFKYENTFDGSRSRDALFYLLAVWNELQFAAETDELHVVGDMPEREWMLGELHAYLKNVYTLNPTAELSRAPATLCKGMSFDMMTFITRGA